METVRLMVRQASSGDLYGSRNELNYAVPFLDKNLLNGQFSKFRGTNGLKETTRENMRNILQDNRLFVQVTGEERKVVNPYRIEVPVVVATKYDLAIDVGEFIHGTVYWLKETSGKMWNQCHVISNKTALAELARQLLDKRVYVQAPVIKNPITINTAAMSA